MTTEAKSWIAALATSLCILLLVGCGDDDGGTNNNSNLNANTNDNSNVNTNQNNNQNNNNIGITPYTGALDALNGLYALTSITFHPFNADVEITREPTAATLPGVFAETPSVRGHGELTASSATAGVLDLRWLLVGDYDTHVDLPWRWGVDLWTASWEQTEGRLVLDNGDVTAVYVLASEADVLTLLLDEDDARNTITDAPVRLVMTSMSAPTSDIAGTWLIHQGHYTGVLDFDRTAPCSPLAPSDYMNGSYGTLSGSIVVENTGWITRQITSTTYDSSDCSGAPVDSQTLDHVFYYEIDNTTDTLRWYYEGVGADEFHIRSDISYTLDGTSLTYTVTEYDSLLDPSTWLIIDEAVYTAAP